MGTNIVHPTGQTQIDAAGVASASVANQSAQAVNAAKTSVIQGSAKTVLAVGTDDEKRLFTSSPVMGAEAYAAEMGAGV